MEEFRRPKRIAPAATGARRETTLALRASREATTKRRRRAKPKPGDKKKRFCQSCGRSTPHVWVSAVDGPEEGWLCLPEALKGRPSVHASTPHSTSRPGIAVITEVAYRQALDEAISPAEKAKVLADYLEEQYPDCPDWCTATIRLLAHTGSPLLDRRAEPSVGKETARQEEGMSYTVRKGRFCDQVISEIRRIRNLCLGTGRSMVEVRHEHAEFSVWEVREQLAEDDRDVFDHPRRWGPVVGYAKNLLAKVEGRSPATITSWVKAYRKSVPQGSSGR